MSASQRLWTWRSLLFGVSFADVAQARGIEAALNAHYREHENLIRAALDRPLTAPPASTSDAHKRQIQMLWEILEDAQRRHPSLRPPKPTTAVKVARLKAKPLPLPVRTLTREAVPV